MTKHSKDWYTSWFDTPFYHILYKDRDEKEAQSFMENLTSYLNVDEKGNILDLACGKGRHAVYLNSIGYNVTGIDLSQKSIDFAKNFENINLKFDVHDMRKPYHNKFNAVFNLFTSFGFFEDDLDDLNTIRAIKANLKENGIGVIDFMNTDFVIDNLVADNSKVVEDITFNLKRYVSDNFVIKDIEFEYDGEQYSFQEKVKALRLTDFQDMFDQTGVQLLDVFGDYKLHKFDHKTSERLIMIFM